MLDNNAFLERALLDDELITEDQLESARRHAKQSNCDIVESLVNNNFLTGRQIALARADLCEVPFVELSDYQPDFSNTTTLPRSVAEGFCVYPLFRTEGVLTVAMDDPLDLKATDRIRQIAKCEVDTVIAEREQIRTLIAKSYSLSTTFGPSLADDDNAEAADQSNEPVVAAVNQIIHDAMKECASDIHINPDEHDMHLRYRIDGVLQEKQGPAKSMHAGIVQRMKVMANLDLTQTRRPQDGKFRFRHSSGAYVDIRMSSIPTIWGENVVLRLLANAQTFRDFYELGMAAQVVEKMDRAIRNPHGILLVTGPTGSGKTTTLYTALDKLNEPSRNIMTIEDPVEIRMAYVRQIQVNHEIGMDFAHALRSILRQDPDVVLVGEIRDEETANIANQAALTGHLVLSTLHTNDAVGTVARLRDYGLPPFVINSSLLGVLAQRLVRRVCKHCVAPHEVEAHFRAQFNLDEKANGFVQGKGCGRCNRTGYRGRVGVHEFLELTPDIKTCIESGASSEQLRQQAMREGMHLMWQDGLEKAHAGQTTLAEIAKSVSVTLSDHEGKRAA